MKKKTVSIMVAATMALSLFAGCGSSKIRRPKIQARPRAQKQRMRAVRMLPQKQRMKAAEPNRSQ